MKHFINIKDIPSKDLRKILDDAKKRKNRRKNLNTLDIDKDKPLHGKLLIQMFEKPSSRTRLSFYLAIKQLGGGTLTLKSKEIHLAKVERALQIQRKFYLHMVMALCSEQIVILKYKNFANIQIFQ